MDEETYICSNVTYHILQDGLVSSFTSSPNIDDEGGGGTSADARHTPPSIGTVSRERESLGENPTQSDFLLVVLWRLVVVLWSEEVVHWPNIIANLCVRGQRGEKRSDVFVECGQ